MFKEMRIKRLKRRARRLYLGYQRAHDHLDCGRHLGEHITGGRQQRIASAFNRTLDKLEALGENPPPQRL